MNHFYTVGIHCQHLPFNFDCILASHVVSYAVQFVQLMTYRKENERISTIRFETQLTSSSGKFTHVCISILVGHELLAEQGLKLSALSEDFYLLYEVAATLHTI